MYVKKKLEKPPKCRRMLFRARDSACDKGMKKEEERNRWKKRSGNKFVGEEIINVCDVIIRERNFMIIVMLRGFQWVIRAAYPGLLLEAFALVFSQILGFPSLQSFHVCFEVQIDF